jgi:uncharacterized membrane protein YqiK
MFIFGKKVVVEWRITENDSMIWRVPNSVYPEMKKIKAVSVKEFERVAFVGKGRIISVIKSGEHILSKGIQEIIWVNISPKTLPFGIAKHRKLLTKDQCEIGLSGMLTLKVGDTEGDIKKFITKIVGTKSSLGYDEIIEWLRGGPLISVFRAFLSKVTRDEFIRLERNKIADNVGSRLTNELSRHGLEIISLDITGIAYCNNKSG